MSRMNTNYYGGKIAKFGGYPYPLVGASVNRKKLFQEVNRDYMAKKKDNKLPHADALMGWIRHTIRKAEATGMQENNVYAEDVACFAALWDWTPEVALPLFLQVTCKNPQNYFISDQSLMEWQSPNGGGGKFIQTKGSLLDSYTETYNLCCNFSTKYYRAINKHVPFMIDSSNVPARKNLYRQCLALKSTLLQNGANKDITIKLAESAYSPNSNSNSNIYSKENIVKNYPRRLVKIMNNTQNMMLKLDLARHCLQNFALQIEEEPSNETAVLAIKEYEDIINLGIIDMDPDQQQSQKNQMKSQYGSQCIACFLSGFNTWISTEDFLYIPLPYTEYSNNNNSQTHPLEKKLRFVVRGAAEGLQHKFAMLHGGQLKKLGGLYNFQN